MFDFENFVFLSPTLLLKRNTGIWKAYESLKYQQYKEENTF